MVRPLLVITWVTRLMSRIVPINMRVNLIRIRLPPSFSLQDSFRRIVSRCERRGAPYPQRVEACFGICAYFSTTPLSDPTACPYSHAINYLPPLEQYEESGACSGSAKRYGSRATIRATALPPSPSSERGPQTSPRTCHCQLEFPTESASSPNTVGITPLDKPQHTVNAVSPHVNHARPVRSSDQTLTYFSPNVHL